MTSIPAFFQKVCAFLTALVTLFGVTFLGWPVKPSGKALDMSKFELTWSDEFNGDAVDWDVWRHHYNGVTGQAQVRRGGYWCSDMAQLKDGSLVITTEYLTEGIGGGGPGFYTFGMDSAKGFRQTYGYFEARCKVPKGEGTWAAFWLQCEEMIHTNTVEQTGRIGAEVDVFESPYFNKKTPTNNVVSSNVHIAGYGESYKGFGVGEFDVGNDIYDEFNTYGVEWNEKEYIFYINGIESGRGSYGDPSQIPLFMVLSVELYGEGAVPAAGWAGDIRSNRDLPSEFVVDYVRAYRYK